jgi:hypothetical protein
MNIEELTVKQVNELKSLFKTGNAKPRETLCSAGKSYFIRTVTHHYTGHCTKCTHDFIELNQAAWIADDGRFHNFLKSGDANEVEPFVEPVRIPIGCVIDCTEWKHALPVKQK